MMLASADKRACMAVGPPALLVVVGEGGEVVTDTTLKAGSMGSSWLVGALLLKLARYQGSRPAGNHCVKRLGRL